MADSSRLQAQGNEILWNNNPVRLRGVAVGDPLLARANRPVSDYAFLARTWRCNAVRISVHPGTWKHRQADALRLLQRDVAAALAQHLWVIIDWHSIGWPDGYYENAATDDSYDSSFELALSFWQAMAGLYGSDGRIAFELWNEPVHNATPWLDPPGAYWPELKARYQTLLAAIRTTSASLVLLGGDSWSHDLRGIRENPVADGNLGYTWHTYPASDGNNVAAWAERLDDLDRMAPVVVTEWGFCRTCGDGVTGGTPEDFGRRFLKRILDDRGLSWTAWVWHPTWWPQMLEADWRTPTEFGRFVRNALADGSHPHP